MKVIENKILFDNLQEYLTGQIVDTIRSTLKEHRLPEASVQELTANIAFHVCCVIDGSLVMELDGKRVVPILTFAHENVPAEVISSGSASWMHEYALGTADG